MLNAQTTGLALVLLVGAAFAGVWVASAVYLGRAFQRKERSLDAAESQSDARGAVAEQRT